MLRKRIAVWWTGNLRWFAGRVVDVRWDQRQPAYRIKYEADGILLWHALHGKQAVKWKQLLEERAPNNDA